MTYYTFHDYEIPQHMFAALIGYIEYGHPVGNFLTTVLENNLSEAVGRADDHNLANLPAYAAYLYNEAPADCWGSPAKVTAWLAKFEIYTETGEIKS